MIINIGTRHVVKDLIPPKLQPTIKNIEKTLTAVLNTSSDCTTLQKTLFYQ